MRIALLICFLIPLIASTPIKAQESVHELLGLPKVDKEPVFKGGKRAWKKFLKSNLKYPEKAEQEGIEGKVFLAFNVIKDGTVTRIEEIRSPDARLTKEAIRVMKLSPKWVPAVLNGENIDRPVFIQIEFKLK